MPWREREIALCPAFLRVADHERNDVGIGWDHRQAGRAKRGLQASRTLLVALASNWDAFRCRITAVSAAQIPRGQCRGEDEAVCVAADRIDEIGSSDNVAAEAAKRFGERAFDDVDAMHGAVTRCHACAARPS